MSLAFPKPTPKPKERKPLRTRSAKRIASERVEWAREREAKPVASLPDPLRGHRGVISRITVQAPPHPKRAYVRSPALLAAIRTLPCMHSGVVGRTEAAHSNWADWGGKGRSIKASDEYCAALSVEVHRELDQGKNWTEAERREVWRNAWVRTVNALTRAGLWPLDVAIPDTRRFDS